MKPAIVCGGESGINALATVLSLGRRGVRVDVVALQSSAQVASATAAAWRPYLGPAEWALFALDDLAPWRKSLRQVSSLVFTRKFFRRTLRRPVTRRA
jgi:NAD(P)-dependent dehydrogenase (short-subunit alcohol dehydrogenase family)